MNGLEELREYVRKFLCEKEYAQQQILGIEKQRLELAQKRNAMKTSLPNSEIEIDVLGQQISKLGNESQELQNKLDFKIREVKNQLNFILDNLVVEGIRRIRKINEEIQELENKNEKQKERKTKYEIQKQEFFARFGRMPELSENAIIESRLQEKQVIKNLREIKKLERQIKSTEEEISGIATIKIEIKNGNWYYLIDQTAREIQIEEINVEQLEPIGEFYVEEFGTVEELYVEEFKPMEEVNIEEAPIKDETVIYTTDKIEELAKAIVEEIVQEQTKQVNINEIEEKVQEKEEDIIICEEKTESKENVIIPLFGQKVTISNIIVKIEDGELVYKAQMSDEELIQIYPAKLSSENVLLRDKQNREECKEILVNYATSKCKSIDKTVVNKIDPLICELLIECAEKYIYDAQELIYNYAMSFSNSVNIDEQKVPGIIYNLSFIEKSRLSRKEKVIINKICKNARKNNKIEIIESFTGFKKVKYIFKRLFAVNNVNVLPEAKY